MDSRTRVTRAYSEIRNPTSEIVRRLIPALMVLLVAAMPAAAQISITGVTPDSAWSVQPPLDGTVTLTITGSFPFPAAMTATLSKAGQPGIAATDVAWVDPVTVTASLSFVEAAVGTWDLEVTHGILGSATLVGALTVKPVPKIRRLTSWGGPVQAMEVVGNLGYVARGSGLVVLDVTDPANMVELDSIDLGAHVYDLALAGDYAYVGKGPTGDALVANGFGVVDISDPTNLSVVSLDIDTTKGSAGAIAIASGAAYVIAGGGHTRDSGDLMMFEISNPANPVWAGRFDSTGGEVYAVTVQGDRAYVVAPAGDIADDSLLKVYDLSDPLAPVLLGDTPVFMQGGIRPSAIAMDGDHAYVTGWSNLPASHMSVVDVSDPAAPFLTGIYLGLFKASDVTVSGGVAYVADATDYARQDRSSGLVLLDVSNPSAPTLLSAYAPQSPPTVEHIAVAGNTAFVLDFAEGVIAVDVADTMNPARVGLWRSPAHLGTQDGLAVAEDFLFANDSWVGMTVLDVSDPRQPTLAAFHAFGPERGGFIGGLVVQDGIAYAAAGKNGLQIVDVADPTNPFMLGEFPLVPMIPPNPNPAVMRNGLAVADGVLIIRTEYVDWVPVPGNPGIGVFDVSDPTNPLLASLPVLSFGPPKLWAISGDGLGYGASSAANRGLTIVDLSDPYQALTLGEGLSPPILDVAIEGTRLYVATAVSPHAELLVYDILPDGTVTLVGDSPEVIGIDAIDVVGGKAYLNTGSDFIIYDLANLPLTPLAAYAFEGSNPGAIHAAPPYVYMGTPNHGFSWSQSAGPGLVMFQVAVPGDADNDFDTDLADYAAFQRCFGGPGVEPPEAICLVFDFDEDNDVDLDDHVGFMLAFDQASVFWTSSDPAEFAAYVTGQGLTTNGFEDFEELNIANGQSVPLNSGTPPLDEFSDIWGIIVPGDIVSGLSIESNASGGEAFAPNHELNANSALEIRGALFGGMPNTKLVVVGGFGDANSYDLVFTTAADVRAVGLDMVQFGLLGPGETCEGDPMQVMVFDTDDKFIRRMIFQGPDEAGQFLGVWSSKPIGRINVWSGPGLCSHKEGADNIQMWAP